jgi:hypothetical protein
MVGHQDDPDEQFGRHLVATQNAQQSDPGVYAAYMNSGTAHPGATITLEVYDESGVLISQTTTIADSGGNWLATFNMPQVGTAPARVVVRQNWTGSNPLSDPADSHRVYFAPAFATSTTFVNEFAIPGLNGFGVREIYEACRSMLTLDWNGSISEFSADHETASSPAR